MDTARARRAADERKRGGGVTRLRLVLARHGQTDSNVRRALDTRPPGAPLNALGRAQARALAARLAGEPVSAVYASVATRAQQTAAPVAAVHGLDVEVVEGVHEIFCGDLEGRSDAAARDQFELVYAAWWTGELDARIPGGESARDLRKRFLPVLDRILDGASGDVVLVSHGAAIRLAAAALLGDTVETQYVPNTGLVVLRPDGAGWVLEQWDGGVPVAGDVTAGGTPA
jgi:probable phosphoglycerate mutase